MRLLWRYARLIMFIGIRCLSVLPSAHLPFWVHLSSRPPSVHPSIHPSIHSSIHPLIYPSIRRASGETALNGIGCLAGYDVFMTMPQLLLMLLEGPQQPDCSGPYIRREGWTVTMAVEAPCWWECIWWMGFLPPPSPSTSSSSSFCPSSSPSMPCGLYCCTCCALYIVISTASVHLSVTASVSFWLSLSPCLCRCLFLSSHQPFRCSSIYNSQLMMTPNTLDLRLPLMMPLLCHPAASIELMKVSPPP